MKADILSWIIPSRVRTIQRNVAKQQNGDGRNFTVVVLKILTIYEVSINI